MILLSIVGLFRTVLIILGVFFLLRILGKMAQARRNIAEDQRIKRESEEAKKVKLDAEKNYGKTSISKINPDTVDDNDYTDFEEVKE